MNKKGNVSLMALAILLVISIYITITLYSISNLQTFVSNYEDFIVEQHHKRAAITRAIAGLKKDILFAGYYVFEDLNQEIAVEEVDRIEETTQINESVEDETKLISFDVLMDTDIYINAAGSGNITLLNPYELKVIDQSIENNRWVIDSSNWDYGTYKMIIKGDCFVDIRYTQVVERTVTFNSSFLLKVILAKNGNWIELITKP